MTRLPLSLPITLTPESTHIFSQSMKAESLITSMEKTNSLTWMLNPRAEAKHWTKGLSRQRKKVKALLNLLRQNEWMIIISSWSRWSQSRLHQKRLKNWLRHYKVKKTQMIWLEAMANNLDLRLSESATKVIIYLQLNVMNLSRKTAQSNPDYPTTLTIPNNVKTYNNSKNLTQGNFPTTTRKIYLLVSLK